MWLLVVDCLGVGSRLFEGLHDIVLLLVFDCLVIGSLLFGCWSLIVWLLVVY